MTTPVLVTADGGVRTASPEEIIEQGVRLYVGNMLAEITKGSHMEDREPPADYVDLLTLVVSEEVKAALMSGFEKAMRVPSMLKEVRGV